MTDRPRIAHITNHGYGGVDVPYGGAPDTGGQNVYVNFIVEAMVELGYDVTVFARGGFPFFESEKIREGVEPYGEHARYVYVPGGGETFIRKEDIAPALDEEVDWLEAFVADEAARIGCRPWEVYEFFDTHYWDAGVMGMLLQERWLAQQGLALLEEVLGGHVDDAALEAERQLGSHGSCGQALEQVTGRLLLVGTDPLASPGQRVEAAVNGWCREKAQERSESAARAAGEGFAARSAGMSPALASVLAADVVGEAVLEQWDPGRRRIDAAFDAVARHVFTPHSLGVLKEENYRESPLDVRRNLKFCERRDHEIAVCRSARGFAATSTEIAERLRTHHGIGTERMFYFSAGVDRRLFREYDGEELARAYGYLSEVTGLPVARLEKSLLLFETSRMDRTKRKDILLQAFARVGSDHPDALCLIGGGPENDIFRELEALRQSDPILRERAFLLRFIPDDFMYPLFSMADIFVTASEMEGFGLSAAQAAAVGTALVTSHLVPFALQYVPDDALIVRAGDVDGFARAIGALLGDDEDREARGRRLAELTTSLDWIEQTRAFLAHLRARGLAVAQPC